MFLVEPKCAVCGQPCSRIEILEPRELPHDFERWEDDRRAAFRKYRDAARHHLLFSSTGGANGWAGDPMSEEEAERWKDAPARTADLRACSQS